MLTWAYRTVVFLPPQDLRLAIEDDMAIEVVILTSWVEDAALHLSEPLKSNGDGDLGSK